jgi:putative NIF3 family GTP cyclohydrolase 1 type 2
MIGELEEAMDLEYFLSHIKQTFHCGAIKYTPIAKKIKKVALCGGSGSFLRMDAMAQGADAYITADMKYHEFFDSEDKMSIIDIGHYESEQFTKELIFNYIKKNVLSLPTQISSVNTNPVKYYI